MPNNTVMPLLVAFGKVLGVILGAVLILVCLLFGYLSLNISLKSPRQNYPMAEAANIASGLYLPHEEYRSFIPSKGGWRNKPGYQVETCASEWNSNLKLPFWQCVDVSSNNYVGCGAFVDFSCISLSANVFLLSKPKRLAQVIDALSHPCKYLPSPQMLEADADKYANEGEISAWLDNWEWARCHESADMFPGKVTLTFYENGKEVLRIVKEKE